MTKAEEEILADVLQVFKRHNVDRLRTVLILADLNALENKLWSTWNQGDGLSARNLADLLKPHGLQSSAIRFGKTSGKGYYLRRLQRAKDRLKSGDAVRPVTPRRRDAVEPVRSVPPEPGPQQPSVTGENPSERTCSDRQDTKEEDTDAPKPRSTVAPVTPSDLRLASDRPIDIPPDFDWNGPVDGYVRFRYWPRGKGPKPDQSGCLAPEEVLRRHGFESNP